MLDESTPRAQTTTTTTTTTTTNTTATSNAGRRERALKDRRPEAHAWLAKKPFSPNTTYY